MIATRRFIGIFAIFPAINYTLTARLITDRLISVKGVRSSIGKRDNYGMLQGGEPL
jgi:hypothetical protein